MFDAAGTLIFPHPSVGEVYAEIASAYGVTVEPKAVETRFADAFKHLSQQPRPSLNIRDDRDFWRLVVRETFGGRTPPADCFDAFFEDLWQAFATAKRWRLQHGTRDLLHDLKSLGLRVALLSNADDRFRQVFRELDLLDAFDGFFLSGEIGAEKPAPAAFAAVEQAMGFAGGEILHVGDSERADYAGALEAGWHALLVNPESGLGYVWSKVKTLLELP